MGGGAKKDVYDERRQQKKFREIKVSNAFGQTLMKKTTNSKRERQRMKNNVWGLGTLESGDGGIFGVEEGQNTGISILEAGNLDDFITKALSRPTESAYLVLDGKADTRHGIPARVVTRADKLIDVAIPRRCFSLHSPDQIIIERALASGRAYRKGMANAGSIAFAIEKGYCVCKDRETCDRNLHAVEIPSWLPILGRNGKKDNKFLDPLTMAAVDDPIDALKNQLVDESLETKDFFAEHAFLPWEGAIELVKRNEVLNFIEWRRVMDSMENTEERNISPYEKNIQFWRQLWRVMESCSLVIQVVDARDPLFYRSVDLEKMATELDPLKISMLLVNKSDYLPLETRKEWKKYFEKIGVYVVFFSALNDLINSGHTRLNHGDKQIKGGFIAAADNDSDDYEEESEDYDYDDTDSEDHVPKKAILTDAALGTNIQNIEGEECQILNAGQLRTLLATLRAKHMKILSERRQIVEQILEDHPMWDWHKNGVATRMFEEYMQDQEEFLAQKEEFYSKKTGKPVPQWYTDERGNHQELLNAVRNKVASTGATRPKLMEFQYGIGTVGYPNVGKSSCINALLLGRSKVNMAVSSTPGKTKHFQTVQIGLELGENPFGLMDPTLNIPLLLFDCPGLVFPMEVDTKNSLVLNGVIRLPQMRGSKIEPVQEILRRCPTQSMKLYNLKTTNGIMKTDKFAEVDATKFLNTVALQYGYSAGKGQKGTGDIYRVSMHLLHNYVTGRLLHYKSPPKTDEPCKTESDTPNINTPSTLFSAAVTLAPTAPSLFNNGVHQEEDLEDMEEMREFLMRGGNQQREKFNPKRKIGQLKKGKRNQALG